MSRFKLTTMFCKHWIYHGTHIYKGDWRKAGSIWLRHSNIDSASIGRLFGFQFTPLDTFAMISQWGNFCDWFYKNHRRGAWVEERNGEYRLLSKRLPTNKVRRRAK